MAEFNDLFENWEYEKKMCRAFLTNIDAQLKELSDDMRKLKEDPFSKISDFKANTKQESPKSSDLPLPFVTKLNDELRQDPVLLQECDKILGHFFLGKLNKDKVIQHLKPLIGLKADLLAQLEVLVESDASMHRVRGYFNESCSIVNTVIKEFGFLSKEHTELLDILELNLSSSCLEQKLRHMFKNKPKLVTEIEEYFRDSDEESEKKSE